MGSPKNYAAVELLERRRLMYASIPAGYIKLETIHIRPKAATYTSDLTFDAGTVYFLRATGSAYTTNSKIYHGDTAFAAGTPVTTPAASASTWGISVSGAATADVSGWGAYQSDHVYGERVTPASNGSLSFTFANDSAVSVSTLAVTIYAPVPQLSVAKIRTNVAAGSITINSLPSNGATIPVNNADFDQNGVADNKQSGAVIGDGFLLPIDLPKVKSASSHNHYTIIAPADLRVWLNADRTGSTKSIGLRETADHTVYVEARKAIPAGMFQTVRILESFDGARIEQDIPISTFTFTGPLTATAESQKSYSVNNTAGTFDSVLHGTLGSVSQATTSQTASVLWADTPGLGYVDFRVNANFIWGLPVLVDA